MSRVHNTPRNVRQRPVISLPRISVNGLNNERTKETFIGPTYWRRSAVEQVAVGLREIERETVTADALGLEA